MQTDTSQHRPDEDEEYSSFLCRLRARYSANVVIRDEPVFTTDATGLFDAYLQALPDDRWQYYNCNACRKFVARYGGLVVIDENGRTRPVFRDGRYWTLELSDGRPVSLISVTQALARPEVTLRVHDPSAEAEVGSPVRFLFRGVTKIGTYV